MEDTPHSLAETIAGLLGAIAATPDNVDLHTTLAAVYIEAGIFDKALEHLERALVIRPGHFRTVLSRAPLFFALGRLPEGWKTYSFRHLAIGGGRVFPSPRWNGEPVAGKKLLLTFEQGLGEQILFASMLPDLRAMGASVVVEVHERVLPLLARSFPEVAFVPWQKPHHPATAAPDIDFNCPLGDAGRWLRNDFAKFPAHTGYLKADPKQTKELAAAFRAGANGRPVIGLAWASHAPHTGAAKSLPVDALLPLLKNDAFHFVSLQHGLTDAGKLPPSLVVPPPAVTENFDGLASTVAAVDAVVSISNATAHLAGAFGKPLWLMLPHNPKWHFWYWFAARSPNPWYPSLRTFVQPRDGAWDAVVADVSAALPALVSSGAGS
jgi:hypothetical protein